MISLGFVLFVGDQPSDKNKDSNIAFFGTRSGKVLDRWMSNIVPENMVGVTVNRTHMRFEEMLKHAIELKQPVIALGNNAAKAVSKFTSDYFKMPHPSGRNRQLNNIYFVVNKLFEAQKYIGKKIHIVRDKD